MFAFLDKMFEAKYMQKYEKNIIDAFFN